MNFEIGMKLKEIGVRQSDLCRKHPVSQTTLTKAINIGLRNKEMVELIADSINKEVDSYNSGRDKADHVKHLRIIHVTEVKESVYYRLK